MVSFQKQCCQNIVNGIDIDSKQLNYRKQRILNQVKRVELALFNYRLRHNTDEIEFKVLQRWLFPSDEETEVMTIVKDLIKAGWVPRTHCSNHRRLRVAVLHSAKIPLKLELRAQGAFLLL